MAGFSNMSEDDYEALSFPSTPPPYRAAMELAAKFGEIDLGSAASAAGPLVCEGCQSPIGHRQRVLSLDETDEMKVDGEESKEESKGDDEESKVERSCHIGAFTYEGRTYCNLECFFFKYQHKPCLCAYVDKLAEVLFSVE
ncbi:hypothetical protein TrCOL_g8987 [Triparma columacea]|uniref:Uncharacterized protein n=1 Tax=Triparma columacea TaxID=722753 RepID=A0A9W7LG49_9STRA|nr:hypothetical protein TrCOL_g8987 [Triparma columacea]